MHYIKNLEIIRILVFFNVTHEARCLKFIDLSESDFRVFLLLCCVHMNSVTPAPQTQPQPRLYPPLISEDGPNAYSPHGILSVIHSTTRRAYQQVMDMLDENRRRWLAVGLVLCCDTVEVTTFFPKAFLSIMCAFRNGLCLKQCWYLKGGSKIHF